MERNLESYSPFLKEVEVVFLEVSLATLCQGVNSCALLPFHVFVLGTTLSRIREAWEETKLFLQLYCSCQP